LIKEMLESGYKKTVGAARDYLWGILAKGTRGGSLLQLAYMLALVALMAGFVSAVFTPVANQSYIVYPSSTSQSIPELLVDSFVILVGGAGVYLVFLSGRQTTRTRTVNLYLGLAVLLVTVSVLTGIEISILKGFG
jgi:hypothetical protein